MGLLLEKLGLKPTAAMRAGRGENAAQNATKPPAPQKSPEMSSLIGRFQEVMGRIKALEAQKAPGATALKLATIAAGNLSTSAKGIVAANAALDKVVGQLTDLKAKLDKAAAATGARKPDTPAHDGKKLADEARRRLKALASRGEKAIAADPRNPNAGWLAEVVANSEERFAALEKYGTEREIDSVRKHLDWLEDSVVRFEAGAAEAAAAKGGAGGKGGKGTRTDDGSSAAKASPDADASSEQASPDADAASSEAVPHADRVAARLRTRLKSLDERGQKAIAADARNPNAGWLAGVVEDFGGRIDEIEAGGSARDVDDMKKQLDWLKESVVRFEKDAKGDADDADGKKPEAEDSPALQQAKAQYKQVMAEIRKLATAKSPRAEELKDAAAAAGGLATSPRGIEAAMKALDAVMADVAKAKAEVAKAKAEAVKERAQAAKSRREANKGKAGEEEGQAAAKPETFALAVAGRKLAGVSRDEAMNALRLETGRLSAQLEAGWAYHVDQMNLPAEVPFQAWLTSGVDAIKSFVKGKDAAKIPDLNIWDPARELMNQVKKAERKGDVKAIADLLPRIAAAIPKARSQVAGYQEQIEDSAQTGVDAGRFVEDTSASAIGAIAEKRGGTAGKIAAQTAAQGLFQGVEQLTEWMIGSRKEADPGAIAKMMGEEAVGAIFKELVAGKLKPLFKSAFGSYLDKSVSDAALKTMGLSRDAFMAAGQKYLAEFAAKQGAGLIKSAIAKLIAGKMPSSPEAMVEAIAAELTKGSGKQLIVDAVKEIAKAAATSK